MEKTDLNLKIDGMHCDACVRRVSNALAKIPGVAVDSVIVGSARVKFDARTATPQQIVQAVDKIGFTAHVA